MNIDGKPYRTIWLSEDGNSVEIIDQTKLPHEFRIAAPRSVEEVAGSRYPALAGAFEASVS